MDGKDRLFHMEAAGSLTPALEGAPASGRHPVRMKKKAKENDPIASGQSAKEPKPKLQSPPGQE